MLETDSCSENLVEFRLHGQQGFVGNGRSNKACADAVKAHGVCDKTQGVFETEDCCSHCQALWTACNVNLMVCCQSNAGVNKME